MSDVVFYGFYDDDSVVDHDTDRQHHSEHCQGVDGESQRRECRKCSDQRDRHCQHRDECGAEVSEEDEHDNQHKDDGIAECEEDLMNRDFHELCGVKRDPVLQSGRKGFACFIQQVTDFFHRLDRVGARQLVDDQHGCRNTVFAAEAGIRLTRQFGAGDVLHSQNGSVRKRADDHVLEFSSVCKAPLHVDRVLKLRSGLGGRLADLSGRGHNVLLADHVGEVSACQTEFRELVRPYPEPHRIVALADDHGGADAGSSGNRVNQVDRRKV